METEIEGTNEKLWGMGYLLFKRPGAWADPALLERAKSLILAVRGREGISKCAALIRTVSTVYSDLPQSWAAWDERSEFLARKAPNERRLFDPNGWSQVAPWLCQCVDRKRTVMFLVPLVGSSRPLFTHYHIPDLPGPNDQAMTAEELLKIIETAKPQNSFENPCP